MCEDEAAKRSLHSLTLRDLIRLRVDIGPNSPYLRILFASLFTSFDLRALHILVGPLIPLLLSSSFYFSFLRLYWAFLLGPIKPLNWVGVFLYGLQVGSRERKEEVPREREGDACGREHPASAVDGTLAADHRRGTSRECSLAPPLRPRISSSTSSCLPRLPSGISTAVSRLPPMSADHLE